MSVRLTREQREEVRRDIATRGGTWRADELALIWSNDRARNDLEWLALTWDYYRAILAYREWLARNYRKVRARARPA